MPLDSSLASSAQQRIAQVREQIDAALQELVGDLLAVATAERHAAIAEACSVAEKETRAAMEKARAESDERPAEQVAPPATSRDDQQEDTERAVADARVTERQCDLACMERVVDALRALDAASTLSHVLDTLADHSAAHVDRVVVFIVRDGQVYAWKTIGFGQQPSDAPIVVNLDVPTVVAWALQSGERATTNDPGLQPLSFAHLAADRVGLAVPLRVGERTVAVLYADEGEGGEPTVPSAWPESVEIVARHAARCLEVLTLARAYALHTQQSGARRAAAAGGSGDAAQASETPSAPAGSGSVGVESPAGAVGRPEPVPQESEEDASALRYARLLISEIKLYHEDAVDEGRRDANLLERLGPEIARARRLYEERVPPDVRSRGDHFGQELVRTLANGDPRLLGQVT